MLGYLVLGLFEVALSRGCYAYSNDVIVQTPNGKGYYPDIFVTCDPTADSSRVVLRPGIIIEVLSNSTELFDRGEKWEQYQKIPSLEQYVLLSQNEPVAEVYSRQGEKWLYERLTDTAVLKFSNLEFEFMLSDLYQNLPTEEAS
jgi:Uma2 family endonuclease